jgi:hypothetical protein
MSKLARALTIGAMLAAMNLAGMTAVAQAQATDVPLSTQDAQRPPTHGQVGGSYRYYHEALAAQAQANDEDTPSQQELADNWNYYNQATHIPPAELKARMQADAAQRKLAERWSYYYQATRMSPAELKAWMQAKDRPDTPTKPPTQVPAAPVQPTEPNGQPTWLVVSLGGLAAALALVAGLALLAARRANRRAQVGHAT